MDVIMRVSNLSYTKDNNKIVNDINFAFKENTVNAFLSSNNSGKTTLIKLLSGIIYHRSGKIIVNNIELNKKNFNKYIINISTILEDVENQFICDTVLEELKYPLINLKYKKTKINNQIEIILNLIKIKSLVDKRIKDLSYYEKVKVLIAASIIHSPKVLFIDDILRFLNKNEREEIIKLFNKIANEMNITILFTTSDISNVVGLTNIYVLDKGKIVMSGTFDSIIMKDNELSKIGLEIPLMIDLSRKLQFYNLVDKIYYDPDKVVDALWN